MVNQRLPTLSVVLLVTALSLTMTNVVGQHRGSVRRRVQRNRLSLAMPMLGLEQADDVGASLSFNTARKVVPYPWVDCAVVPEDEKTAICEAQNCCEQTEFSPYCATMASKYNDQIGSICWHCCPAKLLPLPPPPTSSPTPEPSPPPTESPVEPPPPYPEIDCGTIYNPFRICKVTSCCNAERNPNLYCSEVYANYTNEIGSICWWCCDEPKLVGPPLDDTTIPTSPTPAAVTLETCDSLTAPQAATGTITYQPGEFSMNKKSCDGRLNLSNGLAAKPLATAGQAVKYFAGGESTELFHKDPDGAAVVSNPVTGGWYYVSNAEEVAVGTDWIHGGVGSIEFDSTGEVVRYQRIASNTRNNCGGGRTPWNSWITCEETDFGGVYQTDPTGEREMVKTALGDLGWYESFAFDDSTTVPTFYVTRDADRGVLTRFTPNDDGLACYNQENDFDRWCTLENGDIDYLLISGPGDSGTFTWTTDKAAADANALLYYYNNEGIDVSEGMLYFVAKRLKRLVILDLVAQTYTWSSTESGAFNHQPDQVARLVGGGDILYFCEDGGFDAGIHGRSDGDVFYTIVYGDFTTDDEETTGLAFSPDNKFMYVAYQEAGTIYAIWREDGLSFGGQSLDIKYHATNRRRMKAGTERK